MKTAPFDDTFGAILSPDAGERITELEDAAVIDAIRNHGMVFFRGFDIDPPAFEAFTNRFSSDFMNYKGGRYARRPVNDDGTIASVNYYLKGEEQDTFSLPMHGEMYYLEQRPVLIWFYCVQPALQDGETTVLDGAELYRRLRPATRELFHARRLKYIRYYPESEWRVRFQTDNIDEVARFCGGNGMTVNVDRAAQTVSTEYVHPAHITSRWGGHAVFINNILPVAWQERFGVKKDNLVRFEDDSRIPDEVIAEIESCCDELTRCIPWRSGDFAVVDNTRALHGRRKFNDNVRQIFSRMVRSVDF